MSNSAPDQGTSRDAAYWAKAVSTLKLGKVPPEALNLNVSGKRLVGPMQGFGRMWQRTYRVELRGAEVTPVQVISIWKQQFATFWPKRGRFYGPATAIAPGDVALLNLDIAGGLQLATGIMVLYADDESFTFMNPQAKRHSQLVQRVVRTGPGPGPRQRPAVRAGNAAWPEPHREQVLAADPPCPGSAFWSGAGDGPDHHHVRRPQAPVGE